MAKQSAQLYRLYREHRWFQLRESILHCTSSFYLGALAAAFEQLSLAHSYLDPIMLANPASRSAFHAHELLSWAYIRRGKFCNASCHAAAMAAHRNTSALQQHAEVLSSLSRLPQQFVLSTGRSCQISSIVVDGSLFVPASINGNETHLMIDSGATLSMLRASDAERMGVRLFEISPNSLNVYGATGACSDCRIGVVDRVNVGSIALGNVCVLIVDDHRWQFPDGFTGALGLSALLAMQRFRWRKNQTCELGFNSPDRVSHPNVCFDGAEPVVQVAFQQLSLELILDTGSAQSILTQNFAASFTQMIDQYGQCGSMEISGITGTAHLPKVTLPYLEFFVGNRRLVLKPAPVLTVKTTPNSSYFFGRLGFDLLQQASGFTLDFVQMRLDMEL